MADGIDYTQDQDFLKAPPEEQHGYLMAVDPDYAKAPKAEQNAYLNSIGGTMTEKQAAARPPIAPQTTEMHSGMDLPKGLEGQPVLGAPVAPLETAFATVPQFIGGLAGGMAGSKVGELGGKALGLSKNATDWARDIFGLAGGTLGTGVTSIGSHLKIESPDAITLPGGFKLRYKTPPARTPESAVPEPAETETPARAPKPQPLLTDRQIATRIKQGVMDAAGTTPGTPIYRPAQGSVGAKVATEAPTDIVAGPPIKTPSRNETILENLKNRIPGSNPLEKGVALETQPPSPERTPAQPKEENIHPMDRQFIHVNGWRLLTHIIDKPGLRDDLMDLEGEQLREVLRKSGEDMTHIQKIGNPITKAPRGGTLVDPNVITRPKAFDILMDKGYTPEQILKEAPPRSKPAKARVAFGPPR